MSIFYPDYYYKNVQSIEIDKLIELGIKGLILDLDNTLIDYNKNISNDAIDWINNVKKSDIKLYIVSNSYNTEKVKSFSEKLDIPYINKAQKPSKKAFVQAAKTMGLEFKNIAVIGDQIFTDVLGGNRIGATSILVDVLDKKEEWILRLKRVVEYPVMKSYLKKEKKGENI